MEDFVKEESIDFKKRQESLLTLLSLLNNESEYERYILLKSACEFFGIRLSWDYPHRNTE